MEPCRSFYGRNKNVTYIIDKYRSTYLLDYLKLSTRNIRGDKTFILFKYTSYNIYLSTSYVERIAYVSIIWKVCLYSII